MKKILAGLFMFGFLFVGSQAHASVLSDALTQIKNLENEIAQLKENLTAWGYVVPRASTITTDTNTRTKTAISTKPQCSDGIDNNGNNMTDEKETKCYDRGIMPGVYLPNWNSEIIYKAQCDDGIDNDKDGKIDVDDPNCHGHGVMSEGYTPEWDSENTINNACDIKYFTSDYNKILIGKPVVLSWNTTDCVSVQLNTLKVYNDQFSGAIDTKEVPVNGSQIYYPTKTTGYTLYGGSRPGSYMSSGSGTNPLVIIVGDNPVVVNPTVTNITSTSATLGANITSAGIPETLLGRGFYIGTSPNPTDAKIVTGTSTTGLYSLNVTNLIPSTLYYYFGYAYNEFGQGYTVQGTFKTLGDTGGTLNVVPYTCNIIANASTCTVNLSWSIANPAAGVTSSITTSTGAYVATGNSGTKSYALPYGYTTFVLYNNSKEITRTTSSAVCASSTTWDGSICKAIIDNSPRITVISPNGGETYTDGQEITLRWTSSNLPNADLARVIINGSFQDISKGANAGFRLVNSILASYGSTVIKLPTIANLKSRDNSSDSIYKDITFGKNFKVSVGLDSSALYLYDSSDDFFTINPVGTGSKFPAGCTSSVGYSVTTGLSCSGIIYPSGCTSNYGYSVTTGQSCYPVSAAY